MYIGLTFLCRVRACCALWRHVGAVIVVVTRRLRDGWIRASCARCVFSVGAGSVLFVLITCYLCFVSEVGSCE